MSKIPQTVQFHVQMLLIACNLLRAGTVSEAEGGTEHYRNVHAND